MDCNEVNSNTQKQKKKKKATHKNHTKLWTSFQTNGTNKPVKLFAAKVMRF